MFSSCESFLEEDFRSGITTDNFFNNDAEAQLAVNGLYRLLHNNNLYRQRGLDNFYTHGADVVAASRNVNGTVHNYLFAEGVGDGQLFQGVNQETFSRAILTIQVSGRMLMGVPPSNGPVQQSMQGSMGPVLAADGSRKGLCKSF